VILLWEETKSPHDAKEAFELWCHLATGDYYAVRFNSGRVTGARALRGATALAERRELHGAEYCEFVGAGLDASRRLFTVVDRW
jgi:hypothetical protein